MNAPEPYRQTFLDGRVSMLIGDVRAILKTLPDDHFDCVVTSPPYWGLRSYLPIGHEDKHKEVGLEPTLGEHLAVMVEIFREVRRTLKATGVCWINYGDCYATSVNGRSAADTKAIGNDDRTFRDKPFSTVGPIYIADPRDEDRRGNHSTLRGGAQYHTPGRVVAGGFLKAKDMCLVPERLWIALQDDGWWVRSKFPWIKRNGMPERAEDRPANSLEQIAMLTKSARYWYDAEIVRKAASPSTNARVAQDVASQAGSLRANGGAKTNGPMKAVVRKPGCGPKSAANDTNIKAKDSFHASTTEVLNDRNFRNTDLFFSSLEPPYGLISDGEGTPLAIDANPKGFSEAHFATFPEALIEPLILAGCPAGGLILDPFGGSGTTALVAARLGRRATLIDLNPKDAVLARARIEAAFMGKEEGARHMAKQLGKDKIPFESGTLFAQHHSDGVGTRSLPSGEIELSVTTAYPPSDNPGPDSVPFGFDAGASDDPGREGIQSSDGDVSLARPSHYKKLPDGVRCRCIRLWLEADGSYWRCNPKSQAKATEGKAGMAGVTGPVRRSTAGTGLQVGEASADLPATSEHMDVTAGETAPNSNSMSRSAANAVVGKHGVTSVAVHDAPPASEDPDKLLAVGGASNCFEGYPDIPEKLDRRKRSAVA